MSKKYSTKQVLRAVAYWQALLDYMQLVESLVYGRASGVMLESTSMLKKRWLFEKLVSEALKLDSADKIAEFMEEHHEEAAKAAKKMDKKQKSVFKKALDVLKLAAKKTGEFLTDNAGKILLAAGAVVAGMYGYNLLMCTMAAGTGLGSTAATAAEVLSKGSDKTAMEKAGEFVGKLFDHNNGKAVPMYKEIGDALGFTGSMADVYVRHMGYSDEEKEAYYKALDYDKDLDLDDLTFGATAVVSQATALMYAAAAKVLNDPSKAKSLQSLQYSGDEWKKHVKKYSDATVKGLEAVPEQGKKEILGYMAAGVEFAKKEWDKVIDKLANILNLPRDKVLAQLETGEVEAKDKSLLSKAGAVAGATAAEMASYELKAQGSKAAASAATKGAAKLISKAAPKLASRAAASGASSAATGGLILPIVSCIDGLVDTYKVSKNSRDMLDSVESKAFLASVAAHDRVSRVWRFINSIEKVTRPPYLSYYNLMEIIHDKSFDLVARQQKA